MAALPKPDRSFRGIALTPAFAKIQTRIILNRCADTSIEPEQFAFRPAKNTTQAILALKHALHDLYARQAASYALFVDISKAYDSVSRQSLEHVKEAYGVGATTRELIAKLYEDEILVYDDNRTLEQGQFSSTCGVKQGCILSPRIFTLYMDIVHTRQPISSCTQTTLPSPQHQLLTCRTHSRHTRHRTCENINMTKTELLCQEQTDTRDTLVGYHDRLHKLGIVQVHGQPTALPRYCPRRRATEVLIPMTAGALNCPVYGCPFTARDTLKTKPASLLLAHAKSDHPNYVSPKATIVRLVSVPVNTAPSMDRRLLTHPPPQHSIAIRGERVKICEAYKYLGTWITHNDSDTLDITCRIAAASKAFWNLKNVTAPQDACPPGPLLRELHMGTNRRRYRHHHGLLSHDRTSGRCI